MTVNSIHIAITEESLRSRKLTVRGTASLKQVEAMHIITTASLCLPERSSKHFDGQSNKGTLIGPVQMGKLEDEWQATVQQKREL